MAPTTFRSLQDRHEALLQKQQKLSKENQQDFSKEVKEYIEEVKRGGSYISSSRERDQLRANLRYWANYIYSVDGTFPDTELAPSSVQSKSFPFAPVVLVILALVIVFAGMRFLSSPKPSSAEPTGTPNSSTLPSISPTTVSLVLTQTSEPVQITVSPTPESAGFNVILSSPANGASVTPNIEFKGTFENLKPGWAIHVLFIKGDKYFPIKENYLIPDKPANKDWMIQAHLAESPEELGKAQSYSVVLAISLDNASRELLSNSSEAGIDINSLPPTVINFPDTSRVIYREAFALVQGTRLVYSFYDGQSFDLYTSDPNGDDIRQIAFTPDRSEKAPRLSPDGTKIIYMQVAKSTGAYTIRIIDSNGLNDQEIINGGQNVLESPQWSPDPNSSLISYTFGDTASGSTLWSIHVYDLLTKEDKIISGEPDKVIINRYSSWMPEGNSIVFNTGVRGTGTSGFVKAPLNAPKDLSLFFDTQQVEVQPSIKVLGNGYLLTYTVINSDLSHDVFAITDSDKQAPFDGSPVQLTRTSGGADYPIFDPDSKLIYFTRDGNIYKVQFNTEGVKLILTPGPNTSDQEYFGDLVTGTGQARENLSFDIGNMVAFFPIQ